MRGIHCWPVTCGKRLSCHSGHLGGYRNVLYRDAREIAVVNKKNPSVRTTKQRHAAHCDLLSIRRVVRNLMLKKYVLLTWTISTLYFSMLWVRVFVCVCMHLCALVLMPNSINLTFCHLFHYNDTITSAMAPQITSLKIVHSTVYSGADQRKHQSSASQAFVWGIHRLPANSPYKGPVMRKMFRFGGVIMLFPMCWLFISTPIEEKISDFGFWYFLRDFISLLRYSTLKVPNHISVFR